MMLQPVVLDLYPDADGQPMADNTEQYQWIVRLVSNLRILLKDQTAFVAGDLLWYPLEVKEEGAKPPSQAPDVMVVLGRPAGYRGSYKQWQEEGIPPQVVFEIISPSNSVAEFGSKQNFYSQYGVLEMYFYDPLSYAFWGLVREATEASFHLITPLHLPWVSPILGIRFEMFEDGLSVFYPTGEIFKDPEALGVERDAAREERDAAREERDAAREERDRAWSKLRELGIDPSAL
jgi:Uma2 family endonuclease